MKKQAKADKHPQGPISVTIRKNRPLAVLGIVASLIIGVGIAAYATNNLLHGHVRVNRTVEKADAPTVSENKNAGTQSAASFKATADLVDKYGPAAKSQAVAVAINSAQSLVSTKTSAKAASNRYEALQHGYWTPGTDPMQAIMHGYIPPGMPPQQAAMLYCQGMRAFQ